MSLRAVDYVILYVRDLDRSIGFYRDVVGLPLKLREAGYAEFATAGTRFALYERDRLPGLIGPGAAGGGPAGEAGRPGPAVEVAFLVSDADGEADRLRRAGAEVLAGPVDRPWGHRTVHVLDPDGNVVEFAQEIPRAAPRGQGESSG